jgi:hypothetical protein
MALESGVENSEETARRWFQVATHDLSLLWARRRTFLFTK